ncbi:glycosyltransferase [Neobacillus niacini]|uniref:CgeB family protein n=1 Tax=Neobacillus niacini TaxID=86668 RepID=UPI0028559CBE|nr:glycosyltransferase [Neobacillus niacini]MDR6999847.1 spore maturation protein CgeB [Neobacillus niacini]
MRLFFISSGTKTLSYLDPNIISAFRHIEKHAAAPFKFACFHPDKENMQYLYFKVYKFRPNIIIFLNNIIPIQYFSQLKRLRVPIGLWVVDDPYMISLHITKAKMFDFVITEDSGAVPVYKNNNIKPIHLPLAVNPSFYSPMEVPDKYKYDICFVGSALPIRLKIIDDLTPFLKDKKFILIGRWWQKLKNYSILKNNIINHTIPPNEVAKYYNGTKIVLNIHRTVNDVNLNPQRVPAYTPNNRTFDIAACQAFQLATYRRDLEKYFDLGNEMVCYHNVQDLKEKIDYYLENNTEKQRIAENAYKRTMHDHTYVKRLEELIGILKKEILVVKK